VLTFWSFIWTHNQPGSWNIRVFVSEPQRIPGLHYEQHSALWSCIMFREQCLGNETCFQTLMFLPCFMEISVYLKKKTLAHHMKAIKQHWTTYNGWAKDLDYSRACCVIVVVGIVAYSVNTDTEDGNSSSKLDNNSLQNALLFLPSVLYPLPGKYCHTMWEEKSVTWDSRN
jgi:hypothetical protein